MGKIRVKTFGSPEQEEQEKKKTKEKREAKKTVKAPGLKGGQRVVEVGPSEEELEKLSTSKKLSVSETAMKTSDEKPATTETQKKKKEKFVKVKARSKKYRASAQVLDKSKVYPISEALEFLAKFQKAKFDETVELHLNTTRTGISASLTLPHGTGKKTRVAIADDPSASSGQVKLDTLINKIDSGDIDFDILIAHPNAMPKLARIAKILGPKGLMPNPKNGTITQNPQDLVKKYEAGQISFKTEAKAPLIHLTVGKFSFGDKKLADNINAIVQAVKPENIQKIFLKTTMSPAIKVRV